jgi:hypothetical protein
MLGHGTHKVHDEICVFMNDMENDMRKSRIVNWRQVAPYGDGWRRAAREALIFIG